MRNPKLIPIAKLRRRWGKWWLDLHYTRLTNRKIIFVGPYVGMDGFFEAKKVLDARVEAGLWRGEGLGDR